MKVNDALFALWQLHMSVLGGGGKKKISCSSAGDEPRPSSAPRLRLTESSRSARESQSVGTLWPRGVQCLKLWIRYQSRNQTRTSLVPSSLGLFLPGTVQGHLTSPLWTCLFRRSSGFQSTTLKGGPCVTNQGRRASHAGSCLDTGSFL